MNLTESIRTLVRPLVTLAFVAGYIAAAFVNHDAADTLEMLTGVVVGWWFSERATAKATAAATDTQQVK